MKARLQFFMLLGILLMVPGCKQYVDWGKRTFNQGTQLQDYAHDVQPFIRTVRAYDQFDTLGIFDALWVARSVRRATANMTSDKFCKSEQEYDELLARELAKNDQLITFYLVSDKKSFELRDMALVGTDSDVRWSIYLEIDDMILHPLSFESIDLEPEYRTFFGPRFKSNFKQAYIVTFDAYGVPGQPFITEDTQCLSLVLSMTTKRFSMTWNFPDRLRRQADEGADICA